MMYIDYETAFDPYKKLTEEIQKAAGEIRKITYSTAITINIEDICHTPKDIMCLMLWRIYQQHIEENELRIEHNQCYVQLYHGDILLREYKKDSNKIICFFEEDNISVNDKLKKILQ